MRFSLDHDRRITVTAYYNENDPKAVAAWAIAFVTWLSIAMGK
jgi:hypothetical protein